ncbi:MAG: transporter substrate-binding domain-containing protein [Ruminococcus sp.]|jgi:polar amino acid transport system substrate-binding protein|nr:transporter substrate-binding domain-containing protein [Ruminococcus sp.]MBQ1686848.1 transporter substrate-binding domain-containing protein [Ruminococcus sp.]MBQ1814151.1 transporter substrate-binding domain-containing protein [Ruminococcus sp.]MBQ3988332.1 transporter substrate-binding domain-containing protein [Ruminococcus sp.]MBQ4179431.1 transporter substrate-binding domain-containing protein [Ruminococcus sp.]
MKKIIAFMMAGLMTATALAGCGGSGEKKESATEAATKAATADTAATADSAGEDWTYLESKGNLVIGITYFEPMNYMDENNELTGFETDFAKAVCEELKLEPKFQEIDWDSKEIELKTKSIDCIWNGLTITPERQENMDISIPYMENKQVMVCNKDKVAQFAESVEGASVVAESGSAGEDVAKEDEFFKGADYQPVQSQSTALLEVKAGTADIAIIDFVMSKGTIREDSDFADLAVVEEKTFSPEQYGIALRKNSAVTLEKLNAAIKAVYDSGKLKEIADKYNLADLLIVK